MTFLYALLWVAAYVVVGTFVAWITHRVLGWSQSTATKDGIRRLGGFLFIVFVWPLGVLASVVVVIAEIKARMPKNRGPHKQVLGFYDYIYESIKRFLT